METVASASPVDLEKQYLFQNYARLPVVLARGKGSYVYDTAGKRYLDLIANPEVRKVFVTRARIIASLRRRGYRVVTIPELLGFHPVYVPCMRLCEGIGEPASALPRNAIIERAP